MSAPTTSILLNSTNPPAPDGFVNAKPQSDGATPLQSITHAVAKVGGASAKTANYTAVAADNGTLLSFNSSSAVTLTLPAAPPMAIWKISVQNVGTGTLTVSRNGLNIDGAAANLPLAQGSGAVIFTDGTNYFTERGSGGGAVTFGGDLATVDSTHQKVVGLNGTPIDTTVTPTDGMTLQYNASTGKYVPVFDRATRPVSAVPGKPSAGQLVLIYTAEATETFPANFTAPQSYGSLGVNPTATAVYTCFKNATNVGTVSISTSGVFTFATTSGAAFTLNAGDRFTMVAPGSQDATLSDVSITLVGTRGSVSASISAPPPVITWRGAYSGGTAYSLYDEVSYLGSSYICIAATTGNLPTNTSFWNLVAQAGTAGTNGTNGQMLYVDAQNQTQTYCADTSGSANTITIAPATAATSYVAGQRWAVKVANAVTGTTVFNVSSLGNKTVKKWSSGAKANLTIGDVSAGQMLDVEYDGTDFIAMSLGGGGGAIIPTPQTVLGLWTWLDASQLTGFSDGNSVPTWDDMAKGIPLGTSGTAPIYKTNQINSTMPIIRFNGSNSLANNLPVNNLQYTMFIVLKITSLSPTYSAVWGSDSTTGFFIKSNGKTALYYANTAEWDGSGSYTFGTSVFQIVTLKVGPAGYSTRVALASDASAGTFSAIAATSAFQLGNQNGQAGRGFSGDIAEFLLYTRQLNSTDTSTIENYLKTKYGL